MKQFIWGRGGGTIRFCFLRLKSNLNLLKEISQKQIFRGPDRQSFYESPDNLVSMGNNRLSVIDQKNGNQPMYSNDKRHVVVFNGCIYNFNEIKVCTGYEYNGETTSNFSKVINNLKDVKPKYKTFNGWKQDTSKVENYNDLSTSVKEYIEFLSNELGVPISIISIGPRRNQIIQIEI